MADGSWLMAHGEKSELGFTGLLDSGLLDFICI